MPLRTKGRYLASMTKMSYFPGGSCTRVYSPLAELTALWSVPVSVFLASTLTPAAGACAGSKTEPAMEPDSVWPKATIQQQIPPTFARRRIRTRLPRALYNGVPKWARPTVNNFGRCTTKSPAVPTLRLIQAHYEYFRSDIASL